MTHDAGAAAQDITNNKPEEVLKPEYLERYKVLHKDILDRLIQIDANLQILQTILRYPLFRLYAAQDSVFWTMVFWNFVRTSVLFLHSLASDEIKGAHTLLKFRNSVLKHLRTEPLKSAYRKKLRETKFESQLHPVREKIASMRHNAVAHRILDSQGCLTSRCIQGVSLGELRSVFEDMKRLFETCCFGAEYSTTLYTPAVPGDKPREKDIEQLLDLVVKNSCWLNQPERHARFWDRIKQHKPKEDIEELNKWRAKYNMPPA